MNQMFILPLRFMIVVLSVIGLGISTYLTISYLNDSEAICVAGRSCDEVTRSDYAVFLGLPVPIIGVFGYSILLVGHLASIGFTHPHRWLSLAMLLTALIGVAFTGYLIAVQVFVLYAVCSTCLVSATLMASIFVMTLFVRIIEGTDWESTETIGVDKSEAHPEHYQESDQPSGFKSDAKLGTNNEHWRNFEAKRSS